MDEKITQQESQIETINLGTSDQAEQTIKNLESCDCKSLLSLKTYFTLLTERLSKLDVPQSDKLDQDLSNRTVQILPVRDEFIKVISAIVQFTEESDFYFEIHAFFEQLISYFYPRDNGESRSKFAQDHYKILGEEMFLFTIAIFIKHRRFEQMNILTQQGYYVPRSNRYGTGQFISFNVFNQSLDAVKRVCNSSRNVEYIKVDFTKNRISENIYKYEDLAQADFVLHLISLINSGNHKTYFPDLWAYQLLIDSFPFEIFIRSESTWFYDQFNKCLRGLSKDRLNAFLEEYEIKASNIFGMHKLEYIKTMCGFNKIASRS